MGFIKGTLVKTVSWPSEDVRRECEQNNSVVAHLWFKDHGRERGPIEIRYNELDKAKELNISVGTSSDFKWDVVIPGLKLSGSFYGGRFA